MGSFTWPGWRHSRRSISEDAHYRRWHPPLARPACAEGPRSLQDQRHHAGLEHPLCSVQPDQYESCQDAHDRRRRDCPQALVTRVRDPRPDVGQQDEKVLVAPGHSLPAENNCPARILLADLETATPSIRAARVRVPRARESFGCCPNSTDNARGVATPPRELAGRHGVFGRAGQLQLAGAVAADEAAGDYFSHLGGVVLHTSTAYWQRGWK